MHLALDIDSHLIHAATLDTQRRPTLLTVGARGAIPAVVRRTMHGWQAGWEAAQSRFGNSETTVAGCTRLMGRAANIPAALRERLPFPTRIVGSDLLCDLVYSEVRPAECYSELLRHAAREIEAQTGEQIGDVVLTVPASADDRVRVQARTAAEAAGLTVRRLINQPTAVLLAAELPAQARRVLVVYTGQASTDVTLAEIEPTANGRRVRVLATAGDPLNGGDDWLWTITELAAAQIQERTGIALAQVDGSGVALAGLRAAIEAALPTLNEGTNGLLVLPHGGGFGRDIVHALSRESVIGCLNPAMERVEALCRRLLAREPRPDAVLLTGAMAEWLPLQARLEALCGQRLLIAPPESAALGAALAINSAGCIWDVTPYAVGISCFYGEEERFSPIIAANTPIPTPAIGTAGAFSEPYTTRYPDQTSVRLDVLQYRGEREPSALGANRVYPHECEHLGNWTFENLRPPRGGHSDFTVTFAINHDGILQLEAVEQATGNRLATTVERGIG